MDERAPQLPGVEDVQRTPRESLPGLLAQLAALLAAVGARLHEHEPTTPVVPPAEDRLLDANGVAALLKVSRAAAYALMRRPELSARIVRVNARCVRISERDLRSYLKKKAK
jgi:hypothetical protein